jgi:PIN domain nuclease of toxin-antitoxin system
MPISVLDASAVLAWLQSEPGADVVDPLLVDGVISAANWSEVLQKVAQRGKGTRETADLLRALGLQVEALTEEDAVVAAEIWLVAPNLALGDRCCLALARRLLAPVITADRFWTEVPVAEKIIAIR